MLTDRPPAPSGAARDPATGPLIVAAGASGAAGVLHVAAVGAHTDVATLPILFAAAATLQIGWAVGAFVRPNPPLLLLGAAINATMVIAWAMARTVGWPVVEAMAAPGTVGLADLAAALLAVVALGAALVGWLGISVPSWAGPTPGSAFATVVLIVSIAAVPAVASDAGHDHDGASTPGNGHDHHPVDTDSDHPTADAAPGTPGDAHEHTPTGDPAAPDEEVGSPYDTDDPVISLYDPRLSEGQRAAAQALVDDVRDEMARFTDAASVEAEGYVSIGDGITGYEHFSHPELRQDDITLEPNRPESIVFRVGPDGSRELVSAMFIMPPGSTMDDVPDIAGTLTTWHDHQDLCWSGDRIVATIGPDGTCPRGEFRVGQPMLHVWLVPHPCGPFAGLEGHGGDCRQHAH